MIGILTAVRWHLFVILICISTMTNDVEHLFICLLAICFSSLENVYSTPEHISEKKHKKRFQCSPMFIASLFTIAKIWKHEVSINIWMYKEATIRTGHGATVWNLGKEYNKAVYCHSHYLAYMQSTSCKMPGWMNHKLESILLGEITISVLQMIPLEWQKMKGNWGASWCGWKKRVKKMAWNLTLIKLWSWHPIPSLHGK